MTGKRTTVKKLRSGAKIVTTSKYIPPARPKQIHHHHHHTTVVREKDPCFPSNAEVLTPFGWKAICQIQAGEFVLSLNPATSQLSARKVVKRMDHESAHIWAIGLEGREKPIRTTRSHRFLTLRGWVQAQRLRQGDTLVLIDGSGQGRGTVLSVAPTSEFECVHNLRTETDHNFIVAGAVAHNFVHFPRARSLLATIVEKVGAKAPTFSAPAMNF